jgi:hypothetical protein
MAREERVTNVNDGDTFETASRSDNPVDAKRTVGPALAKAKNRRRALALRNLPETVRTCRSGNQETQSDQGQDEPGTDPEITFDTYGAPV